MTAVPHDRYLRSAYYRAHELAAELHRASEAFEAANGGKFRDSFSGLEESAKALAADIQALEQILGVRELVKSWAEPV